MTVKNEIANTAERQEVAAKRDRNISDIVLARVTELSGLGELVIPADYSAENAMKSAWLTLQEVKDQNDKEALTVCTKESVCNALLDMVVQGLSPAKKQCYFVVYGHKLQLMRSYMGTVAVAKRFSGVKDVFGQVIYEGDDFEYEIDVTTGNKKILRHVQKFENVDVDKIKGAYAVVVREEGNNYIEIMTMEQIKKAWGQGATKGSSPAHKNFAEEMAKKTVINRACKLFVNTSNDSAILADAFNRTTEAEYPRERHADVVIDAEEVKQADAVAAEIFGDIAPAADKTEPEGAEAAESGPIDPELAGDPFAAEGGTEDAADQG